MFRNGITAGRRPLVQSIARNTHELPFVCRTCQARGYASSRSQSKYYKPMKPAQKESFIGVIKRLESHVQLMERNYVEQLRKRAAEKAQSKNDITDEEKDLAYQALMAPPAEEALFLPKPTSMAEQLPAPILQRLGGGLELVAKENPRWDTVLAQIEANGGFEGLNTFAVNGLVGCMDLEARVQSSSKILEMMEAGGVAPNTFTYDLLMLSQAALGNSVEVKVMFKDLQEKGLKPTVYTYGHLLKAYSQEKDIAAAASAFQDMQAAGIEPNLIVYTTLIQTCINSKDFDTAWQIFNLIKFKSTATAPDVSAYTLMISACAAQGETERALDLYTDMTIRKELVPTHETFHALIHACAVRKDYFAQAWKYAIDMQKDGMKLDRLTFNVLIQACGRTGELTRARLLVRHMSASGSEDLIPDKYTYQNLLRAYATYHTPSTYKGRKSAPDSTAATIDTETALFTSPDLSVNGRTPTETIPFLPKPILSTKREVVDEAALIVNWLRDMHPEMVDTQLINSFLDICINQDAKSDFVWSYNNDLENPANPFAEPEPKTPEQEKADAAAALLGDLPKLKRNIHTFRTALQFASKYRDITFARIAWKDRMSFQRTMEYWKEDKRLREKRDFEAEIEMATVLALTEHLGEARERLMILAEEGGMKFTYDDLKRVYVKAAQLEDYETVRLINKITGKTKNEDLPTEY